MGPNGVNFTQSVSTGQPTYSTTAFNGLGGISFVKGGNAETSSTLVASGPSTAETVFIANQPSASNGALAGIWGQYYSPYNSIRMASGTAWQNGSGTATNPMATISPACGAARTTAGWPSMADRCKRPTMSPSPPGQPQVIMAIGSTVQSGTYDLGTSYPTDALNRAYTGLIGEVVVYSGTLTTAQQAVVNAYLDAKWLGVAARPAAAITCPPRPCSASPATPQS